MKMPIYEIRSRSWLLDMRGSTSKSPEALTRCMRRLSLLLTVVACSAISGVVAPEPYEPPMIYQRWWDEVQECTQLTGNLSAITWFVADEVGSDKNGLWAGLWVEPHHIYIQRGYQTYWLVIKHEMIHDLRQKGNHDSPMFRAECTK